VSVKIFVNEKFHYPHKAFIFPGGEVQVRLSDGMPATTIRPIIRADIRNSNDIMETFLVTDALYRKYPGVEVRLVCPYFPYARQDRVCYPGEAFSAQVMINLINAQGYSSVTVWDAHSNVILRNGIHRVENVSAYSLIDEWGELDFLCPNNGVVVAPDKGAVVRAEEVSCILNGGVVQAEKIRDPNTGQITGTVVHSDHIGDKDFLIVDDICDGGRTFTELAKKLKELTTGRVLLYVTHGIFSAGFDVFRGLIDHIYVANSYTAEAPTDFVSVMPQ
jgi:ribose-phosphate pyrophosphokinase